MIAPVTEHASHTLIFETHQPGFIDITGEIGAWLDTEGVHDGLLTLFIAHTSASLTIQENADPDVLRDLTDALERMAPREHPYRHTSEGSDDMPSHIKSMVTSTSLSIPVQGGRMALGTWQGVYLVEHRDAPHRRRITLTYLGSSNSEAIGP
jgi:secondary thiamine-phosphate synthase enzyme